MDNATRSTMTPTKRLCRAVELGYQRMQPMRDSRYRFLCQYVGPFYSKHKGEAGQDERKASPVNLMWQAVTTLVPNLVAQNPQFLAESDVLAYREYGEGLAQQTNILSKRIRLAHTLRKTITDALFGPGFIKTGIAVSGQTLDLENNVFQIGAPYADRVDPDDMILDGMAREWDEQLFVGNRFRVPKLSLLDSGLYDNGDDRKALFALRRREHQERGVVAGRRFQHAHDGERTLRVRRSVRGLLAERGRHHHAPLRQRLPS
jgi:hypothetical protein